MTWEDGHVSPFTSSWLEERSFTHETRQKYDEKIKKPERLWMARDMTSIPTVDYNKVQKPLHIEDRAKVRVMFVERVRKILSKF